MPDVDLALEHKLLSVPRYVSDDAVLRLTVFNAAAGVTVRVAGRRMNPDGIVIPFADRLVPSTNRAASTLDKQLNEGHIIGVTVSIAAGAPLDGQTYVVLAIGRSTGSTYEELDVLAAGTISAAKRISFPGSPILGPLDGAGALRSITGTTPGAGAEISETVPTGANWELLAFKALLTASVTVANRLARLVLDDGSSVFWDSPTNTNQTASQAIGYRWAAGMTQQFVDSITNNFQALPAAVRLTSGYRIRTITSAIQVGDQWSAVQYLVRERNEGA